MMMNYKLSKTITNKAPRHQMNSGWGSDNKRMMYQIGG